MDERPDALAIRPALHERQRANAPGDPALPLRYSDGLAREIIERVLAWNHPKVAAGAAGLPLKEFVAWQRAYEEGRAHPKIVALFEAIERAECQSQADFVEEVAKSKDMSLDQKFKVIQSRFREEWQEKVAVVHETVSTQLLERLEGLRSIDRMMTGEQALLEAHRLISGG